MSNRHRIPGVREHVGTDISDSKRPNVPCQRWTRLFCCLLIGHLSAAPVPAGESAGDPIAVPDGISTYTFVPERSSVLVVGGFAGLYETCPVQGQFTLSVDRRARTASFLQVDANALSDNPRATIEDLDSLSA